jgi:hypothetical protein
MRFATRLELPFAAVGATAGWIADGFLVNPLVGFSAQPQQLTAAVVGGIAGLVLGAILGWRLRTGKTVGIVGLAGHAMASGGWAGGVVGYSILPQLPGVESGITDGAVAGIAFVPVLAVVLAAAKRAERARHGSVVAGADARAVWSILATALGVATLPAALDPAAARFAEATSSSYAARPNIVPGGGLVLALAAGLVVLAALAGDAIARVRLARLGAAKLEERDVEEAKHAAAIVPTVDLGVGDAVHVELGRAASAYRSRKSPVALLLGSLAQARAAVRRALVRGVLALAVVQGVVVVHVWAASPAAFAVFLRERCEHSQSACTLGRPGSFQRSSSPSAAPRRSAYRGDQRSRL